MRHRRCEALEELASNARDLRAEVQPCTFDQRSLIPRCSRSHDGLSALYFCDESYTAHAVAAENDYCQESKSVSRNSHFDLKGERHILSCEDEMGSTEAGPNPTGRTLPRDFVHKRSSLTSSSLRLKGDLELSPSVSGSGLPPPFSTNELEGTSSTIIRRCYSSTSLHIPTPDLLTDVEDSCNNSISIPSMEELKASDVVQVAMESIFSLVTALYELADSKTVPDDLASRILEHTPSIDVAFRRVKNVISGLYLDNDFDSNRGNGESGGGEVTSKTDGIVKGVRRVAAWLDCAAETVRHITGSTVLQPDMECTYITVLELLSLTCWHVHWLDKDGFINGEAQKQKWVLNRTLRQAWQGTRQGDKLCVLVDALFYDRGDDESCFGIQLRKGGKSGVDATLFIEVAILVLRSMKWYPKDLDVDILVNTDGFLERARENYSDDCPVETSFSMAETLLRLGKVLACMHKVSVHKRPAMPETCILISFCKLYL